MRSRIIQIGFTLVGLVLSVVTSECKADNVDGLAKYGDVISGFQDEVVRLDIYYISWYSNFSSPAPTKIDIPAMAETVMSVRDPVSAKGLLNRIVRYVNKCVPGQSDLADVRLRIDVVGSSGSLLGSITSDGELIRFDYSNPSSDFLLGCATEMFRFIFALGDPGFSGYPETHLKLVEELRCDHDAGVCE